MKNKKTSTTIPYDLILGKFMYRVLESANLIPQNDFRRHFNPTGIKFTVEYTTKLARAQLASVEDYVARKGLQELTNWYCEQLEGAQQYQEWIWYKKWDSK